MKFYLYKTSWPYQKRGGGGKKVYNINKNYNIICTYGDYHLVTSEDQGLPEYVQKFKKKKKKKF